MARQLVKIGLTVIVVALLAAGLVGYHEVISGPNSAISAISTPPSAYSSSPTTSSQINPTTSLEFMLALNSSTVRQGHILAVSLNLLNTLDKVNNVTGAEDWRLTNQSENGGAEGWNCAINDVFRIEVVSGYYGLNNFSKGTPLDIFVWQPPFGYNQCLLYVRAANAAAQPLSDSAYGQNYYIFSPQSNVAQWVTTGTYIAIPKPSLLSNSTGSCNPCNAINQRAVMNETMILKTALFANSTGVFTVICGDEWGDLEVSHFYIEA